MLLSQVLKHKMGSRVVAYLNRQKELWKSRISNLSRGKRPSRDALCAQTIHIFHFFDVT